MVETLPEWIEARLKEKGWRPADLARAARLPDSTVSRILNKNSNAGPEVCIALSRALREPPEKVFRLAGLLPPLLAGEEDETLHNLLEIVRRLGAEDRAEVLAYAKFRSARRIGRDEDLEEMRKRLEKLEQGSKGAGKPGSREEWVRMERIVGAMTLEERENVIRYLLERVRRERKEKGIGD